MCENTLQTLQQKGAWRCCNKKLTLPWDQMSTCYEILKYSLRPWRQLAILSPLCCCWHGDLQHRSDSDTVIPTHYHARAISAPSNLSAACKPALNSQFPFEQKKKKLCQEAHCHGAISDTAALQGEYIGDLTAALTSSHHILLFWKETAGRPVGHSGSREEGSACGADISRWFCRWKDNGKTWKPCTATKARKQIAVTLSMFA